MENETRKQFVAYWFFVGWDCFSVGCHICFGLPNIEIHLPFGFIRIGWVKAFSVKDLLGKKRPIGYDPR